MTTEHPILFILNVCLKSVAEGLPLRERQLYHSHDMGMCETYIEW